jgi:sentrin-specific protease 7
LAEGEFLNDQIIDFWFRYFLDSLPQAEKERVYVFNTFFYNRLTVKPAKLKKTSAPWEFDTSLSLAQKRHARVARWTKKVDIFEKEFLFLPINQRYGLD